ncbi:hypothetical protein CAC42_2295 [Sphaceloma murrayae]|uniref:Uncharacterized protein n=1 Tax=Sphaceloma murrayae TaxID=2082308 RepID=A0A2K1QIT7_9PEZI|nr:hypothetical protein CAC42_2295 [Sphaceloma murrayae]
MPTTSPSFRSGSRQGPRSDVEDMFDGDSGYSSPVTVSSTFPLSKRLHKPASSFDASIPEYSRGTYGHAATAWSVTGSGPSPHGLARSPSKLSVDQSNKSASNDNHSTAQHTAPPSGSSAYIPQPETAFQRRMQMRTEWTQRGSVRNRGS